MDKKKFKRKSLEFCDSAMKFAEELKMADNIISDLENEDTIDDKEARDSKLRKLKECFAKLKNYSMDSSVEAAELNGIIDDEDPSLKRKMKAVKKNYAEVKELVSNISNDIEKTSVMEDSEDTEEVNFSELIKSNIKKLFSNFSELKEASEDAVDSVLEVSEALEDKKDIEEKEDSKEMKFSEKEAYLDEAVDKIQNTIEEKEELKQFAEELKELKDCKCESEEDLNEKLEKVEEFCDKISKFFSEQAEKEESNESEDEDLEMEVDVEVKEADDKINFAIRKMKRLPGAKNFSEELDKLEKFEPKSEEELDEKLKIAEDMKEEIVDFEESAVEEDAKDEVVEETEIDEEKIQELAECADKMEDIISSLDVKSQEEVAEEFANFTKKLGDFCDNQTKETKEELNESIKVMEEFAKSAKTFSAKRAFSKLAKCFTTVKDSINTMIPEEDSIDAEIEEQNTLINEGLDVIDEKIDEIKDEAIQNFARKRLQVIKKMVCFSEGDIEEKLSESEDLKEDIEEVLKSDKSEFSEDEKCPECDKSPCECETKEFSEDEESDKEVVNDDTEDDKSEEIVEEKSNKEDVIDDIEDTKSDIESDEEQEDKDTEDESEDKESGDLFERLYTSDEVEVGDDKVVEKEVEEAEISDKEAVNFSRKTTEKFSIFGLYK